MDTADRNYIENLIEQAKTKTTSALAVAEAYGLTTAAQKLAFAVEFEAAALTWLPDLRHNPDGTTGPEHVTSEGIELGPPKG